MHKKIQFLLILLAVGTFVSVARAETPRSALDNKPSVDSMEMPSSNVGQASKSTTSDEKKVETIQAPEQASRDGQSSYVYDLKKLINKSRENIKRVNDKIKEQAVIKRNQKREERAREYYERGMELNNAGKFNEAREYFEKAIRITEHPEMSKFIQQSEARLKAQDAALRHIEKLNQREAAGDEQSRMVDARQTYEEAVRLYREKKFREAKDKFDHIEETVPDYRATKSYLRVIDQDIIAEDAKAQKDQKLTMDKQEKEAEAARQREKEVWKKEIEQKEKDRKVQVNQQAQKVYEEAVALYKEKKFAEARKKFQEVGWVIPDYKATNNYLSRMDHDIAEEQKRIDSEKSKALAQQQWEAEVERRKKEIEDAKINEQKEKARRKQFEEEAQFTYQAALTLYDKKLWDEALEKFNDVEKTVPGYKSARIYITKIATQRELEMQRKQEADAKELKRRQLEDEKARDAAIQKHKQLEEARLKEERRLLEADADIIFNQGLDLMKHENFEGAKQKFEEVSAKIPNYKRVQEYVRKSTDALTRQRGDEAAAKINDETDAKRVAVFNETQDTIDAAKIARAQVELKPEELDAFKKKIDDEKSTRLSQQQTKLALTKRKRAEDYARRHGPVPPSPGAHAALPPVPALELKPVIAAPDLPGTVATKKTAPKAEEAKHVAENKVAAESKATPAVDANSVATPATQTSMPDAATSPQAMADQATNAANEANEANAANATNVANATNADTMSAPAAPLSDEATAAAITAQAQKSMGDIKAEATRSKIQNRAERKEKELIESEQINQLSKQASLLYQQIALLASDRRIAPASRKMAQVDAMLRNLKRQKEILLKQIRDEEERDRALQLKAERDELQRRNEQLYEEAIMALRQGKFDEARDKFATIEARSPNFKSTRQYLQRIDTDRRQAEIDAKNERIRADAKELKQLKEEQEAEEKRAYEERRKQSEARKTAEAQRLRKLRDAQEQEIINLVDKASLLNDEIIRLATAKDFKGAKLKLDELGKVFQEIQDIKRSMMDQQEREELARKQIEIVKKNQAEGTSADTAMYKNREEMARRQDLHKEAVDLYKQRKFASARMLFKELESKGDKRATGFIFAIDRILKQQAVKGTDGDAKEREAYIAYKSKNYRRLSILRDKEFAHQKALTAEMERQRVLTEEDRQRQRIKDESVRLQQEERRARQELRQRREFLREHNAGDKGFKKLQPAIKAAKGSKPKPKAPVTKDPEPQTFVNVADAALATSKQQDIIAPSVDVTEKTMSKAESDAEAPEPAVSKESEAPAVAGVTAGAEAAVQVPEEHKTDREQLTKKQQKKQENFSTKRKRLLEAKYQKEQAKKAAKQHAAEEIQRKKDEKKKKIEEDKKREETRVKEEKRRAQADEEKDIKRDEQWKKDEERRSREQMARQGEDERRRQTEEKRREELKKMQEESRIANEHLAQVDKDTRVQQKRLDAEQQEVRRKLTYEAERMYKDAMRLYKDRKFVESATMFQDIEDILPAYKQTRRYLDKSRASVEIPPSRTESPLPAATPTAPEAPPEKPKSSKIPASRDEYIQSTLDIFDSKK